MANLATAIATADGNAAAARRLIAASYPHPEDAYRAQRQLADAGWGGRQLTVLRHSDLDPGSAGRGSGLATTGAATDDNGPPFGRELADTAQDRLAFGSGADRLIRAGIPPTETDSYLAELRQGGALLLIYAPPDRLDQVMATLQGDSAAGATPGPADQSPQAIKSSDR